MSAIYGRKVINKTNKGYEVDGKAYPTLTAATDAIQAKARRKK